MLTVERTFGFETQFIGLGSRRFPPEGVMNLRRRKGDGVDVGMGRCGTMPAEIKCLECAIEEEVVFPITECKFVCPVLLEALRSGLAYGSTRAFLVRRRFFHHCSRYC